MLVATASEERDAQVGLAVGVLACGVGGAGAALSGQADPRDRAVSGGQRDRRHGAAGQRPFHQGVRSRAGHREHGRRDRLDRVARDREGGAGRLHHHVQHQLDAFGQRVSLNNLGYDPIADFTPLALLSRAPHAMVVRAEAPYPAFRDFVAFAKANPDKLNFGYGNTGSLAGGAMLNAYAGIKTTAVSYRGTPQVTTDLLGGQIEFVVMDVSTTQEHVKAGKLRTLAVTGQTRMEIFPDAPTMIELGYPDFVLYSWNGVHAPAGCHPISSRP